MGPAAAALAVAVLLPGLAKAAELHVPAMFATVQQAIDQAANGDRVLVAPGDHAGPVDFLGKIIHVTSTAGPRQTILRIEGGAANSVVSFTSGEERDSILEGFTITGGAGTRIINQTYGGGVLCDGSSPTLRGNILERNVAVSAEGCVHSRRRAPHRRQHRSSEPGKRGSTSRDRRDPGYTTTTCDTTRRAFGAAAYDSTTSSTSAWSATWSRPNRTSGSGGGISCFESFAVITENFVFQNASGLAGGGISCEAASPVIRANTIQENEAVQRGGGISCDTSSLPSVEGNRIDGNRVYAKPGGNPSVGGGGIWIGGGSRAAIIENHILRNTGARDALDLSGGGISIVGARAYILRNRITANTVDRDGGGLFAFDSHVELEANRFETNDAGRRGGAIALVDCEALLHRERMHDNRVTKHGGGLFASATALRMHNCALTANNAREGSGGGIFLEDGDGDVLHATISGNRALRGAGIAGVGNGWHRIAATIVWGNTPDGSNTAAGSVIPEIDDPGTRFVICHSLIRGGWPGDGNRDADPLLADAGSGNVYLRLGSPCVDAAPMSPVLEDLNGDLRPPEGSRGTGDHPDIGADELRAGVAARFGTVGASHRALESPLTVNGSAGNDDRIVHLNTNDRLVIDIAAANTGPATGRFALYLWRGEPDATTVRTLPRGLGHSAFPTPFDGTDPFEPPIAIWNNLGRFNRFGRPDRTASPAPTTLLERPHGTRLAGRFTLQGFLLDDGSSADAPLSVTNAVVLDIAPR